jgi:hypothetical protein
MKAGGTTKRPFVLQMDPGRILFPAHGGAICWISISFAKNLM